MSSECGICGSVLADGAKVLDILHVSESKSRPRGLPGSHMLSIVRLVFYGSSSVTTRELAVPSLDQYGQRGFLAERSG